MRIGVDLLWVRPGICGGTESFVRNLLDGFSRFDDKNEYVLFAAKDNAHTFAHYAENPAVQLCVCKVNCRRQPVRILWENLFLDRLAEKQKIDVMYIPVYSMPKKHGSKIPYVCTVHDLQALHYPEYFSCLRRIFLKHAWKNTCKRAERVIVTSDYTRDDLKEHYPNVKDKVNTISIAVVSGTYPGTMDVLEKYGLRTDCFYYCVSSMLPHKNLQTLLKTMALRRKNGDDMPLVLSGVGGNNAEFEALVSELELEDTVINTGFVSDAERDCLYENCRLFLFPSVFEGFGMPPIEAMRKGKAVVMTRESCLEEVTEGKGTYVDAPYDAEEWNRKIDLALQRKPEIQKFEKYEMEAVCGKYLEVFEQVRRQNERG